MKIVVLAGGLSPERNVSLSTGTMVAEALTSLGHEVAMVDMYFGLKEKGVELSSLFGAPISEEHKRVSRQAPDLAEVKAGRTEGGNSMFGPGVLELCGMADLVFLALHGSCGEDGRVQAAFDLMGIPYTGSGYLGSAIAMDKDLTKRMVADVVSTPGWKTVSYTVDGIDELVETARLPLVVKPVASGSSIGVSIAHTAEELRTALTEGLSLGGRTVLEQYVKGRELQVAILEDKALPAIEIIPKQGFYDYENKYQPGGKGVPQLIGGVGDGHPDGGAAGHRLDHQGQAGGAHQLLNVLRPVLHRLPAGGMHHIFHQPLGQVLVHSDGAAQIARPGVGNPHQLQGRLDSAVLAAGAVEGQEHQLRHLAQLQHMGAEHTPAVSRAAGAHLLQVWRLAAHLFQGFRHRCVKKVLLRPLHAKIEVHQSRPVAQLPQGIGHHGAGGKGYIPLRGKAAGQHDNLHIYTSSGRN